MSQSSAFLRPTLTLWCGPHNVSIMVVEFSDFGAGFNVPEHAGHVARGGDDLLIAQESAAGQVACVRIQFTADTDWVVTTAQVIDGANVVETTAGDEGSRGAVRTRHHPRRAQGNGVNLISGRGVPNQ